jgi:hypothetical protein
MTVMTTISTKPPSCAAAARAAATGALLRGVGKLGIRNT